MLSMLAKLLGSCTVPVSKAGPASMHACMTFFVYDNNHITQLINRAMKLKLWAKNATWYAACMADSEIGSKLSLVTLIIAHSAHLIYLVLV